MLLEILFFYCGNQQFLMSKKKKFRLEFVINSSPTILFKFLSTPSGMAQWFADHVDQTDKAYSFFWEGYEEKATCIESIEDEMIRYSWDEGEEGEYFEFKIEKVDITNDTVLVVTDFAEEEEVDNQSRLWASQIKTLSIMIGAG